MNRLKSTLLYAYTEGFRDRLAAVKRAAAAFAAGARWSEEHACYDADTDLVEALCTAAFEMWKWERMHYPYERCCARVSEAEGRLVIRCQDLGERCYADQPSARELIDLCTEAVHYSKNHKENV